MTSFKMALKWLSVVGVTCLSARCLAQLEHRAERPPQAPQNGGRIALVSTRDGNPEIYVMQEDGTGQKRLTFNTRKDSSPSISADGRKVAFISQFKNGNLIVDHLCLVNSDGTRFKRLSTSTHDHLDPTFSPDGARLLYVVRNYDRNENTFDSEIHSLNLTSGNIIRLTGGSRRRFAAYDREPQVSPNGRKIAFFSMENSTIGKLSITGIYIYVMNADGTGLRRLARGGGPQWNPTSDALVFFDSSIWTINADGTKLRDLSPSGRASDGRPSFSPDGNSIAFTSGRSRGTSFSHISLMRSDGSGRRHLTNTDNSIFNSEPTWTLDGKTIIFTSNRDVKLNGTWRPDITHLYALDLDTKRVTRLTNNVGEDNQLSSQALTSR